MSKIVIETNEILRERIKQAVVAAQSKGDLCEGALPEFTVEVPADRNNGDLATNAAMASARVFRMPPRAIAQKIIENIDLSGTYLERPQAAGPGFINFFFNDAFYAAVLRDVADKAEKYGRSDYGGGKRINVEFVSANPTGPMHMGNARGGALGDCLAAVLDMAGYDVEREFYINDAGNQIEKFALSLDVRYCSLYLPADDERCVLPEDSYHGEDILQRAKEFSEVHGDKYINCSVEDRRNALVAFALPRNIDGMKQMMSRYNIKYDTWFNESALHGEDGEIKEVIDILTQKGLTYEKDGALWYKNAEVQTSLLKKQGKDEEYIKSLELKDDVLIRANGNTTYFAADIAYHRNKLKVRGFDKAIDIWGADHHGHVARLKGALSAIGLCEDDLDIVLMQLVRLIKDGEPVRMSKRTGKAISLKDLLDDIPTDAVRFLFNMQSAGSQMDFDLDLAVEQSSKNPVYYVQYAYARICSIFRKAKELGVEFSEVTPEQLERLNSAEERELIHHIAALTDEVIKSAEAYDPARITRYVVGLATLFHKFYNAHRVFAQEQGLTEARLYLCECVRITIGNVLRAFKISAPERM